MSHTSNNNGLNETFQQLPSGWSRQMSSPGTPRSMVDVKPLASGPFTPTGPSRLHSPIAATVNVSSLSHSIARLTGTLDPPPPPPPPQSVDQCTPTANDTVKLNASTVTTSASLISSSYMPCSNSLGWTGSGTKQDPRDTARSPIFPSPSTAPLRPRSYGNLPPPPPPTSQHYVVNSSTTTATTRVPLPPPHTILPGLSSTAAHQKLPPTQLPYDTSTSSSNSAFHTFQEVQPPGSNTYWSSAGSVMVLPTVTDSRAPGALGSHASSSSSSSSSSASSISSTRSHGLSYPLPSPHTHPAGSLASAYHHGQTPASLPQHSLSPSSTYNPSPIIVHPISSSQDSRQQPHPHVDHQNPTPSGLTLQEHSQSSAPPPHTSGAHYTQALPVNYKNARQSSYYPHHNTSATTNLTAVSSSSITHASSPSSSSSSQHHSPSKDYHPPSPRITHRDRGEGDARYVAGSPVRNERESKPEHNQDVEESHRRNDNGVRGRFGNQGENTVPDSNLRVRSRSQGRAEAGEDEEKVRADLSVVSVETDRSSDSGLDSGHQSYSSDFDEQIDVVGDDDARRLDIEDKEEDVEDKEDMEDEEEEGLGHEVDDYVKPAADVRISSVSIPRPLPKRLTPELSSPPAVIPRDLLRFGDPRFWQAAATQPYMGGFDPRYHHNPLSIPPHMLPARPPMHTPLPLAPPPSHSGVVDNKPTGTYLPFHPSLLKRLLPPEHHKHPMLPGKPPSLPPWLLPQYPCSKNDGPRPSPPARKPPHEPPRYHCEACKKSYATFSGLSKHKQFHCESHVKKEFSCKFCSKTYTSLGALKMHIRTHTLPCKCDLCGKAFSRPWLLQGHIRTHTGEKPFSCQHCHRSFADRSNLRAHLQTHSDIKKYCCNKCSKTFSRMSLLHKHEENSCPAVRASNINNNINNNSNSINNGINGINNNISNNINMASL